MPRSSVLSFVKNNECIIERTAPHKRQGSNFNGSVSKVLVRTTGFHHLKQCIIQRTDVRVDFLGKRTRKKTEVLTSLDNWSREDNATNLFVVESCYRHSHSKVCFASTRRTNAKRDRVLSDGIHVLFLRGCFRTNRPTAIRKNHIVLHWRRCQFAGPHEIQRALYLIGRKSLARLKRFYQTREKRGKRLHLKSVALNAKRILMQGNSRSSGVFD